MMDHSGAAEVEAGSYLFYRRLFSFFKKEQNSLSILVAERRENCGYRLPM
jgi:hypothetical protein